MISSDDGQQANWMKRLALSLTAVVLVYAGALLCHRNFLPGTLGNLDSASKLWQVESLLHGQRHLTYPGADIDPEYRFFPTPWAVTVDGKPYSVYFSLFTYITYGAVRVMGRIGYNLVPLLASFVTVLVMGALMLRVGLLRKEDLWKAVGFLGICTPLVYYAVEVREHSVAAMFAAVSFLLVAEAVTRGAEEHNAVGGGRLAISGVMLALAAVTRGECYFLALATGLAVVVFFLRHRGLRPALVAGSAMFVGGVMTLALWFAVNPLSFQIQRGLVEAVKKQQRTFFFRFWRLLFSMSPGRTMVSILGGVNETVVTIICGVVLAVALCLALLSGTRRTRLRHLATVFYMASLGLILGCWYEEGFVVVCPIALTAAFLVRARTAALSPTASLVFAASGLYLVLCWLLLPNAGAGQFGPRFLLPVLAPLCVVLYCLLKNHLQSHPSRWLGLLLALALISGFTTELKGILLSRHGAVLSKRVADTLRAVPSPLVFHRHAALYHAPEVLLDTRIFEATSEQHLREFADRLREHDVETFTLLCHESHREKCVEMLARARLKVVEEHSFPFFSLAITVTRPLKSQTLMEKQANE